MLDQPPFADLIERIAAAPRSGQSLLLYGLFKTLCPQRGGHAYLLTKLKEMEPQTRQLAFRLMEAMAAGTLPAAGWEELERRLDALVAGH